MTTAIARPESTEYAPYYDRYVSLVPAGDLLAVLTNQGRETRQLLGSVPDAKAGHRYAAGKWSIREVVGHVMDAERVFCHRALRFARDDRTPLPGFDEQAWTPAGKFDSRSLPDLTQELATVRQATLALFGGFDAEMLGRRGVANGKEVSVRALAYIIAGHERHHCAILRERYLV